MGEAPAPLFELQGIIVVPAWQPHVVGTADAPGPTIKADDHCAVLADGHPEQDREPAEPCLPHRVNAPDRRPSSGSR